MILEAVTSAAFQQNASRTCCIYIGAGRGDSAKGTNASVSEIGFESDPAVYRGDARSGCQGDVGACFKAHGSGALCTDVGRRIRQVDNPGVDRQIETAGQGDGAGYIHDVGWIIARNG